MDKDWETTDLQGHNDSSGKVEPEVECEELQDSTKLGVKVIPLEALFSKPAVLVVVVLGSIWVANWLNAGFT